MKILIQLPEGLKHLAPKIKKEYEEKGHQVFFSSQQSFGACDIDIHTCEILKPDLLIHYGHSKFFGRMVGVDKSIKIEYKEFRTPMNLSRLDKDKLKEQLKPFNTISLLTTVQFLDNLPQLKEILGSLGKEILIGKGSLTAYEGQVLGCDMLAAVNVDKNVDCHIFFGDGNFHPIGIEQISKPFFILDVHTSVLKDITDSIEKKAKKARAMLVSSAYANTFGILVSTKPGQNNLDLASNIKKKLEEKGKSAYILISNFIDPISLSNFNIFDAYINTACPRLIDDADKFEKPIVNLKDFNKLLELL